MWLDKLATAARSRVDTGYYDERPSREDPNSPGSHRSLAQAIQRHDPAIVAEIKPARPEGQRFDVDPTRQAKRYAAGGACAISVLTDPDHFDGSLKNLQRARTAKLPVLMKDFLVDPRQLEAAAAWGADAVLAIARLPREQHTPYAIEEACEDAHELGLEVLVEVVTEDELATAIQAHADVIGINVRDLDTLEVDPERTRRLLASRRVHVPVLHLSGVSQPADLQDALAAGADGALVGTHLMQAEDPTLAIEALVGEEAA